MLSRVADSIYWMNRYLERAENYARFLDVNLHLALDQPLAVSEQWMPLVETTGDRELFIEQYGSATTSHALRFLISDETNPNSIFSCVRSARENAALVREMLSGEMWLHINKFYLTLTDALKPGDELKDHSEFLQWVKDNCALHMGIMDSTLSHSEAWHFGCLGRYLERADKTSRLLDIKYFYLLAKPEDVGSTVDLLQWQAVLRSASALEMFRRSEGSITPAAVASFLILHPDFPRTIRFCLNKAEASLRELTPSGSGTFRNEVEKRLGAFRSQLDYTDIGDVFKFGMHEYLDMIQVKLNEIGDALQNVLLVPPQVPQPPVKETEIPDLIEEEKKAPVIWTQ
ncbi:MAG: alpha-E domain-containing protein [Leptospirales bacterium]|nr:alpha-E domain-containing protein [Leptospirales bacterium]